jgi:DNA-binding MarR family transcriptional regulator
MFTWIFDQVADLVSITPLHRFTEKQGQYLAFIHTYVLLNRRPPAEADFQRFFLVSPPAVHQMIVTLERNGLISRVHGQARSIQLLVSAEDLPSLQPIKSSAVRY